MSSSPTIQDEQLIELLLTLKKTTPEQARTILSSTPQIAYALVALMVKMNAVDVQVLHNTVAAFSANAQGSATPAPAAAPTARPVSVPPVMQQPPSAIPSHLSQQSRTSTPPSHPPTPSNASQPPPQQGYGPPGRVPGPQQPPQQQYTRDPRQHPNNPYQQQHQQPQAYNGYGGTPQAPTVQAQQAGGALPENLAALPDEQKAMIARIIAMTPEQINMLPQAERASIVQLRATLGLPS
ncbi:hypothetical protein CONPUDRAFT_161934 [Coniophora puteana RWD-64-598 SS2]|uniref:Transcription termination and cleavage factor C-terminal domain-containing protein n=1 Tax=Coniophora puteana (strain RWD-64-598) TaxID=741705 RepID=A0A5M3N7G2_CONPW|nr:uncharacterized protein CONPUDRAFT_161934 [Coniophora puteana RWD-64-598 SS2]EIW87390.1 hypothetical protein CONPUDRAFT_161934 [Coniophora puteana RWD-64-598 SS2]